MRLNVSNTYSSKTYIRDYLAHSLYCILRSIGRGYDKEICALQNLVVGILKSSFFSACHRMTEEKFAPIRHLVIDLTDKMAFYSGNIAYKTAFFYIFAILLKITHYLIGIKRNYYHVALRKKLFGRVSAVLYCADSNGVLNALRRSIYAVDRIAFFRKRYSVRAAYYSQTNYSNYFILFHNAS